MGCGSSKSTVIQHNSQNNSSQITKGKAKPETTDNSESNAVQSTSTRIEEHSNNNLQTNANQNNSPKMIPNGHHGSTTQQGNKENVQNEKTFKTEPSNIPTQRRNSSSGVAFEVKLDENASLSKLRRPPKLQKLDHAPVLTADMLAKKQALAEENRQKEIQKKVARTSQRKKRLLEARELDMAVEAKRLEIEEKMNAQSRKRAKAQAEIIEKQRIRELKAKRVRERAQRIREGCDDADFEVDPDETYNADEENESWDITGQTTTRQPTEHDENNNNGSRTSLTQQKQRKDTMDSENEQTYDTKNVHDFFEE